MFDTLHSLFELQSLSNEQRQNLYRTMPKTVGECRIYSIMLLSSIWGSMIDDENASLLMFCRNLHEWHKARKFDKMHMYLVMFQCAYCIEPPPFLLEFSLFDDLLEMVMGEIMRQADTYCKGLRKENDDMSIEEIICPACAKEMEPGRMQL